MSFSGWTEADVLAIEQRHKKKRSRPARHAYEFAADPDGDVQQGEHRQTLVLFNLGPTLNDLITYNGAYQWTSIKRKIAGEVRAAVGPQGIQVVTHYPVRVSMVVRFGKGVRSFDCENLAPTSKAITDALVKKGILKNDSRQYVKSAMLASARGGEHTEILYTIIEPASL